MPNSKMERIDFHRTYTHIEIDAMGAMRTDGSIDEDRIYAWVDEQLSLAEDGLCEYNRGEGIECGEERPGPNYLPGEGE